MNSPVLAIGASGTWEFFVVAALLLIAIGASKLPIFSRTPGESERESERERKDLRNKPGRAKENTLDARFVIIEPEKKMRVPSSCLTLMTTAPC